VSADIRMALAEDARPEPAMSTVIAGLGGRPITRSALRNMLTDAATDTLEPLSFLDLDKGLVERELLRARQTRRSGPSAENMLRDHRHSSRAG
jgi:pyruvate ferredoxin oxidoreductase alpha subunit